jgi:hypothetical protein
MPYVLATGLLAVVAGMQPQGPSPGGKITQQQNSDGTGYGCLYVVCTRVPMKGPSKRKCSAGPRCYVE